MLTFGLCLLSRRIQEKIISCGTKLLLSTTSEQLLAVYDFDQLANPPPSEMMYVDMDDYLVVWLDVPR